MRVVVVGMGLIGGSFFKAAHAAGYDPLALHHHDPLPQPSTLNSQPTLILVCLPPEAIVPWIESHAPDFPPNTIVVDICGVKRPITSAIQSLLTDSPSHSSQLSQLSHPVPWVFVGGHPMAGREVSGFANSKADLFVGASMILTPFPETPPVVLETLKSFFKSVGFLETVITTPEKHDDMIAFTSQLCHVIATTYSRDPRVKDAVGFSAGSYANMTRIATQDADVWSALYAENRDALVSVLDAFAARFKALRDAIASGDTNEVKRLIDEGTKAKRDELLARERGDER